MTLIFSLHRTICMIWAGNLKDAPVESVHLISIKPYEDIAYHGEIQAITGTFLRQYGSNNLKGCISLLPLDTINSKQLIELTCERP